MNRCSAVWPVCCLHYLWLCGFSLPAGAAQGLPDEATLFASPTRKDRIGRIVAPVMINGQGPFRFIVDTGASQSTASPQLVQSLGLQVAADAPILVNGITGTAQVPSVWIDRLQAGDLVFRAVRLPVIWAPLMAGADGILGVAGLKTERILVEFTRNRVSILRSRRNDVPLGFVKVVAKRLGSGLMAIDARVGGVRAVAVVDTGAERSLGNLALREALRTRHHSGATPEVTEVYGSTSDVVAGEVVTAPMISIGPVKIADVDVVFGDFHIFEVWKLEAKPALIIGMDVLGSVKSLAIDFRTEELYVEGLYLGGES